MSILNAKQSSMRYLKYGFLLLICAALAAFILYMINQKDQAEEVKEVLLPGTTQESAEQQVINNIQERNGEPLPLPEEDTDITQDAGEPLPLPEDQEGTGRGE